MKIRFIQFALLLFGVLGAFQVTAQKPTLGIVAIKPIPSLAEAARLDGRSASLQRLTESLDSQMVDRFNAVRKFELVSRTDLKANLDEIALANSGNINTQNHNAAKAGQLEGAKYVLITTIDEFIDRTEELTLPTSGKLLRKRVLSFGAVAKIYDSTTGKLLESASHKVGLDQVTNVLQNATTSGDQFELQLREMSRQMSEWVANRVADVVFPVKVLAKTDKTVTINRGEGGGLSQGDEWRVFAVGKELIDPDTKEVLGKEEVPVGRVRITDVLPKFSKAEVLGEDLGIEAGAILRPAK